MELVEAVGGVLRQAPGAAEALAQQPASAWTRDAAKLAEVVAPFVPPPGVDARAALFAVLRAPGAADFVRLLLEPGSAHTGLGLALVPFVGPNDELAARLRELPPGEVVTRALSAASGEGRVQDLEHWMGKPYTSPEVQLSIKVALDDVSALGPKQLGRHGPRLVELLRHWTGVTGGDAATERVYRLLQRSDLSELIRAYEAHFATMSAAARARAIEDLRDLYFRWPTGAQWAENVVEYFEPSEEDDDEPFDDGPSPEVSAFRRR